MAIKQDGKIQNGSEGGVTGSLPRRESYSVRAAPATSDERNTITSPLIPLACWRLDDVRFEFDSSFVRPEVAAEMVLFAALMKEHPGATVSIFGHADPIGNEEYNKQLSGRRALAIYGMLTRNINVWEDLYSQPFGGDKWGPKAIQIMLSDLGFYGEKAKDNYSAEAIEKFQRSKGLPPSGTADSQTRAKLFLAYMDKNCQDKVGQAFTLEKKDFLAQGADPDGKGDYQGCSEFNPVLLFSQEEKEELSKSHNKSRRDLENAPNRRLVALLFRAGCKIIPKRWPCPRVKEGVAGCKERLWSDNRKRLTYQAERREYGKSKDTFGCRFYDRLAHSSPCEQALLPGWIDIETVDEFSHRIGNVDLILILPDGRKRKIRTDAIGYYRVVLSCKGDIRVTLPDGSPAKYLFKGEEKDVVLHTDYADMAITHVVAKHNATPEEREELRQIKELYGRDLTKAAVNISSRGQTLDPLTGEHSGPPQEWVTRRSHVYTCDNLAIAAGFRSVEGGSYETNIPELLNILKVWLQDHNSTTQAKERGYYILMLTNNEVTAFDRSGGKLGKFQVAPVINGAGEKVAPVSGLFGAYSSLEDVNQPLFTDLADRTYGLSIADSPGEFMSLEELLEPGDRQLAFDLGKRNQPKVQVLYYVPTGNQLAKIALHGGTGKLEDYGEDSEVNRHIHERNLKVVTTVKRVYEGYLDSYIEKVNDAKHEDDIRKLGPPISPYIFPCPVRSTPQQFEQIWNVNKASSFKAWKAIAEKLDKLAGVHPEGTIFFRLKIELEPRGERSWEGNIGKKDLSSPSVSPTKGIGYKGGGFAGYKMEWNFDVGTDGFLNKSKRYYTAGWKGKLIPNLPQRLETEKTQVPFNVELKAEENTETGEKRVEGKLGVAGYEFSARNDGRRRFTAPIAPKSPLVAFSEFNNQTGEFGGGTYFTIPNPLKKKFTKAPMGEELGKVYIGLHFQGIRQDTLLAYFSNAPGFFERRSAQELLYKTQWDDLHSDERARLDELGWKATTWDKRHEEPWEKFPPSARTNYEDLTPSQRIAAVHLGLGGGKRVSLDLEGSNWIQMWKAVAKK